MAASPLAPHSSLTSGDDSLAPATVAFRRPDGRAALLPISSSLPQAGPSAEVVLRLPDVNASPETLPASLAGRSNPLIGKLMWAGTAVLGVIAILLLSTAPSKSVPTLDAAPRWNVAEPAATSPYEPTDKAAVDRHPANLPSAADAAPAAGGPWRAEAQLMQPHDAAEFEPPAGEAGSAGGSAGWPGDAWPGGHAGAPGLRQDQGAAPGTLPTESHYPRSGYAAPNAREDEAARAAGPLLGPGGMPANGAADAGAEPAYDPWPGPPQWPAGARNAAPPNAPGPQAIRTATRPAEGYRPGAYSAGGAPVGNAYGAGTYGRGQQPATDAEGLLRN